MLVLFETAAGYALFKLLDDGKLANPEKLWQDFDTPESANEAVKLKAFQKFENMSDAVSSVTALLEGKLSKDLKRFLKESIDSTSLKGDQLAVADQKLGAEISKKLGIKVISDSTVLDLYRGIRQQLSALISDVDSRNISSMALGLSHSLSRYKLKFSTDKVDTMIIQAIGLLDDLDKELNTYSMRVKEWYGWHFPEMGRIVNDNLTFAKVIKKLGVRSNSQNTDLSEILPSDIEKDLKEAAEISMGTEIAEDDILNITFACDQVISLSEYRTELYQYLQNRMSAIAPNLSTLVGDLVGARLIARAGSLISLSKQPASTVQILGAEKALFRALKTKHNTPKYGLIYHASLVGQAGAKNKGKIARVLAGKASLAARIDALGEEKDITAEVGRAYRSKIESRIRHLEGRFGNTGPKSQKKTEKFEFQKGTASYNTSADVTNMEVDEAKESKPIEAIETTKIESDQALPSSSGGQKRKAKEIESKEDESESESGSDTTSSSEAKPSQKKRKQDEELETKSKGKEKAEESKETLSKKSKAIKEEKKESKKVKQLKEEKVKEEKVKEEKVKEGKAKEGKAKEEKVKEEKVKEEKVKEEKVKEEKVKEGKKEKKEKQAKTSKEGKKDEQKSSKKEKSTDKKKSKKGGSSKD
ncbi:hypothetical protein G9A89_015123 [Geosiphon pyriformis]|nr:hypothetical protein G9A89_015123 [Geosiphon pyriformis]